MSKGIVIAAVVVLGLGGLFLALPKSDQPNAPATNNAVLSVQTIRDDVSKGGQLIDVRTASEYASGHIDGAVNISLQDIQAGAMPTAPKDKPVYVYCRSGNRSSQATSLLKAAGYQNIIDLGAMTHVQSMGGVIKT